MQDSSLLGKIHVATLVEWYNKNTAIYLDMAHSQTHMD